MGRLKRTGLITVVFEDKTWSQYRVGVPVEFDGDYPALNEHAIRRASEVYGDTVCDAYFDMWDEDGGVPFLGDDDRPQVGQS